MSKVLIDTNVLIALFKGDRTVANVLARFDNVLVSTVVLGEFKAGIVPGTTNGNRQAQALDAFLRAESVNVTPINENVATAYANTFRKLKTNGTPIPQNDIWIAASARACDVPLFSFDAHFAQVEHLKRIERA